MNGSGAHRADPLLRADGVARAFLLGEKRVVALQPTSVAAEPGQLLVITGASGSGKSTLLHLLSGLDRPTQGRVLFKGRDVHHLPRGALAALLNGQYGFVFQTPHLLADRTILENVLLPYRYGERMARARQLARASELLDYVGLLDFLHRYPGTLSGGEMQRVVFARALVRDPEVIFADEPTGSLDGDSSRRLLDLLRDQTAQGRTVVMATHDATAAAYATHRLHLDKFDSGRTGAA